MGASIQCSKKKTKANRVVFSIPVLARHKPMQFQLFQRENVSRISDRPFSTQVIDNGIRYNNANNKYTILKNCWSAGFNVEISKESTVNIFQGIAVLLWLL